jgi:uncharacterized protein YukE
MSAIIRALIRLARKVVENVISQLTQQLNVVEESAMSPIRATVQAVVGGVWIGDGANAFVDEVSSLMIPGVAQVGEQITTMRKNIENAVNVIDRADEQINTKINSLADVFDNIYRG